MLNNRIHCNRWHWHMLVFEASRPFLESRAGPTPTSGRQIWPLIPKYENLASSEERRFDRIAIPKKPIAKPARFVYQPLPFSLFTRS